MSTDDFESRLAALELSQVTITRDMLLEDARMVSHPEMIAFAEGLEKNEWTVEELLRHFEECPAYLTVTATMRKEDIVTFRRTVRNFIAERAFQETEATHLVGRMLQLKEEERMQDHVRTLIREVMENQKFLRKVRGKSIDPETATISVPRIAAALNTIIRTYIQKHEKVVAQLEADGAGELKIAIAKSALEIYTRQRVLVSVMKQMADELIGTTDVRFFMEEMKARLEEADPVHAEELLEHLTELVAGFLGNDRARKEPGYMESQSEARLETVGVWQHVARETLEKLCRNKEKE